MNFGDQLTRIRRMLRDPNGNIWTRQFLKTAYNDIQRDLQRRTRMVEQIAVLNYPPLYQQTFTHDWEWPHMPSDQSLFFQCLRYHQQSDYTFTHRWEAQSEWGSDDVVSDNGINVTQPWEGFLSEIPTMPIAIRYPENFHAAKFLAYNRDPLEMKTKKAISLRDSAFETRSGTPFHYYREDDFSNAFIPYPRPSTITWEEDDGNAALPDTAYSQAWEATYITTVGEQFTRDDATNNRVYVFPWELEINDFVADYMRGMWLFEVGTEVAGQTGQVTYTSDNTNDTELGTITRLDGYVFNQDDGIAVSVLGIDDEFLLIYDAEPTEIQDDTDESDFPIFCRKYIEYGVISRAYGALSDGKIASLRDYWDTRYQMGVEAVKLYIQKTRNDRDYRMSTKTMPARRQVRHAMLPSTYPPI